MQAPSIVQMLAPAAPTASAAEEKSSGDRALFSKLLNDANGRGSKQPLVKKEAPAKQAAEDAGDGVVVPLDDADAIELRNFKLGPQEAAALIRQIDMMQANAGGSGNERFERLKEQLQDIVAGGESVDVASLLDNLPAAVELQSSVEQNIGSMQRMMRWLKDALQRQKDTAAALAAVVPVQDSTVQSLQAANFRPLATEDSSGEAQAPAQKTDEMTVVQPLAQELAMPAWAQQIAAAEPGKNDDAAMPPTALADDALPEINLPGSEDIAKDIAPTAGKEKAKIALPDFSDQLHALPEQLGKDEVATTPVTIHAPAAAQSHSATATGFVNAAHALAPNASAMPHVPVSEQVHMAVTTLSKDGIDRITLQLEPADLGRVEIQMEMKDGTAKLSFMVDKPETLDNLSRDARSLERMLQDAGIKADAGTMQFNLRQQQPQFSDGEGGKGHGGHAGTEAGDEHAALSAVGGVTTHHIINVREGVDIHA